MEQYRKAIAAFIGASAPILAGLIPALQPILTPEVQAALSVLLATVAAWWFPNTIGGKNVMDLAKDKNP